MVRYFYLWTPLFVVLGTMLVLSSAYLALIALVILAPLVLAGLVAAIVGVPYLLGRAVGRRLHAHGEPGAQPVAALSPVERPD